MRTEKPRTIELTSIATLAIIEQSDFYSAKQGLKLANKWQSAVVKTVDALCDFSERGAKCRLPNEALAELRWVLFAVFLFAFSTSINEEITVLSL